MRRLLIIGCSARKRGGPELIPAVERYDGPMWQILRNYARGEPSFARDMDVLALSAEFGLISARELIPPYERKMVPERAAELHSGVLERLRHSLREEHRDICLALSDQYMLALTGWDQFIPAGVTVTRTTGPIGVKLAQLKAWLRAEQWVPRSDRQKHPEVPQNARSRSQIAGVRIEITRDDLLAVAREALVNGDRTATHIRDWYVPVDDSRVAPKWLVSKVTGLPTSRFDASDARRVLLQLGVAVQRS